MSVCLLVGGKVSYLNFPANCVQGSHAGDSSLDVVARSQYNVEHRVIMDAGGVRVQITKFVKIGSSDDDDPDFVNDEGTFDFGSEVERMFRAMADDSDAPEDSDNVDVSDPNPDGLNPNMLPAGEDGRPSDIRSLEGYPDAHDRVRMNLLDDGLSADPEHLKVHRSDELGWEATTAVIKASHVIRPSRDSNNNKRSSAPPRSVFAKLAPSRDRYTILRDEL